MVYLNICIRLSLKPTENTYKITLRLKLFKNHREHAPQDAKQGKIMRLRIKVVDTLKTIVIMLLPPANEVCEGYVFTPVCLSIEGRAW